jgi:hypothetical protein
LKKWVFQGLREAFAGFSPLCSPVLTFSIFPRIRKNRFASEAYIITELIKVGRDVFSDASSFPGPFSYIGKPRQGP